MRRIALLTVLILINAAVSVIIPKLPQYFIDHIMPTGRTDLLVILGAISTVALMGYAYLDYWLILLSFIITQDVVLEIRVRVFRHLQYLNLAYFENRLSGALLSRVINDVNQLQEMTQSGIARLGRQFITLAAVLIMMFLQDWRLSLVVVVLLPPMSYIIFKFGIRLRVAALESRKQMADMTGFVSEILQGVSVVKAFAAEEYELTRFTDESKTYRDLQNKQRREMGVISSTVETASNLGTVIVVCVGGWYVMGAHMSVGELMAFILYVNLIFRPVINLVMFYGIFQQGIAAAERVFELLDTKDEVPEPTNPVALPDGGGRIEFEKVTFAYKIENEPVLKNVSFNVQAGTTTALVGPSGGGKTTVIKLIPRFYDPQKGTILVEGNDVRSYDIGELRSTIGMVLQESFLFSGTVRENIAYGKPDATDGEIEQAGKLANAHEFIIELPDEYATEIGERGVKLSGGQKQRIAIARAILRNPRILIFDEATSNLDSESERLIQGALENLFRNRTTVVIAHRLSTIIRADQIIVIENGVVSASGKHEELLETCETYRHLYELQFEQVEGSSGD